jgi:Pentapeptide repeats (8 copies)
VATADTTSDSSLQPSVDRLRTAARWLIGAFGAIGAAVAIGAQFSNLGKLEGHNRDLALLGVGLAFGGIGLAIWASARVLVPRTRYLIELGDRDASERRRLHIVRDPALSQLDRAPELLRPFTSLAELNEERRKYLDLYTAAYNRWSTDPTPAHLTAIDKAKTAAQETEAVAADVIDWATYATIRRVFQTSSVLVFIGVALAAAGMTIFALKIPDVPPSAPTPAAVSLRGLHQAGSTQFRGKSLQGADLTRSDFSNANLTGTDLSGAQLAKTTFHGTDFSKANLEGATGLTPSAVTGAKWNATTCPDGRSSDAVGKTCVSHLVPPSG